MTELTEISKQRLGAYIKKVPNSMHDIDKKTEQNFKKSKEFKKHSMKPGDMSDKHSIEYTEKANKSDNKYVKRSKYFTKAIDRLTKESEELPTTELDEVSVSLINRYMNKASRQHNTGEKDRGAGIDLALKKKYGNKKYGIPEPKVKATEAEELSGDDLQEISKQRLEKYITKSSNERDWHSKEAMGSKYFQKDHLNKAEKRSKGISKAVDKHLGNKLNVRVPATGTDPVAKKFKKESEELTMDKNELLEALVSEQPVTFKTFITALLEEKANTAVDSYVEEMFSDELSDEDLDDIFNELSDEEFEALMDDVFESITEEDASGLTEEDLLEISKQRLGAYIKKAADSKTSARHRWVNMHSSGYTPMDRSKVSKIEKKRTKGIAKATDKLTKESVEEPIEEGKALPKMKDSYSKKDESKKKKSWKDIRKSANKDRYKMTEEEQLDEISKQRLHSYVMKASDDKGKNIRQGSEKDKSGKSKEADKHFEKSAKRWTGMNQALHKLRGTYGVKVPAKD